MLLSIFLSVLSFQNPVLERKTAPILSPPQSLFWISCNNSSKFPQHLCTLCLSLSTLYYSYLSTHIAGHKIANTILSYAENPLSPVLERQLQEKEKQVWSLPSCNLQTSDCLCFSLVSLIQARTDLPCTPLEMCMVFVSPVWYVSSTALQLSILSRDLFTENNNNNNVSSFHWLNISSPLCQAIILSLVLTLTLLEKGDFSLFTNETLEAQRHK